MCESRSHTSWARVAVSRNGMARAPSLAMENMTTFEIEFESLAETETETETTNENEDFIIFVSLALAGDKEGGE